MKVFLAFLLLISVSTTAAAPVTDMILEFKYSQMGATVCEGQKQVQAESTYLVCDERIGRNRVFLKVIGQSTGNSQVYISAMLEEIDPDGKVIKNSTMGIHGTFGEPAEISMGLADGTIVRSFRVTPTLVK